MVIVVVMSLLYEPVGFMVTCLLFLIAYGYLLGERRPLNLILTSVIITIILYIGFAVLLGVLLPRGQISFLRNFALFVESLVPTFLWNCLLLVWRLSSAPECFLWLWSQCSWVPSLGHFPASAAPWLSPSASPLPTA